MTWTAKNANLMSVPVAERLNFVPAHLREVIDRAGAAGLLVDRVWIFGSRAIGGARANSDFDLAFKISNGGNWAQFVTGVADDVPSLYKYDLVDVDNVDPALRSEILTNGVLIYESRQHAKPG